MVIKVKEEVSAFCPPFIVYNGLFVMFHGWCWDWENTAAAGDLIIEGMTIAKSAINLRFTILIEGA